MEFIVWDRDDKSSFAVNSPSLHILTKLQGLLMIDYTAANIGDALCERKQQSEDIVLLTVLAVGRQYYRNETHAKASQ